MVPMCILASVPYDAAKSPHDQHSHTRREPFPRPRSQDWSQPSSDRPNHSKQETKGGTRAGCHLLPAVQNHSRGRLVRESHSPAPLRPVISPPSHRRFGGLFFFLTTPRWAGCFGVSRLHWKWALPKVVRPMLTTTRVLRHACFYIRPPEHHCRPGLLTTLSRLYLTHT